ncbi:SDR family NAD(P)-dependent oxidoreductase [Kurthia sibirica]|uniref:Oxidoreductase n=1 Tax=Kurthia sibirica TaxID=202750 RepID=A0A2U3ALL5_9BACL|nr:SDR family NAD(P)-dependent oxidoreductase [Kurthia sibirica]PWI25441.1 oxidoreductase [Kurthia sibirica]GEK34623.1 oxidoreductase [Kurthia sibirica]
MEPNKSVFITGATSGVGWGLATALLAKNYVVYATGRNEEQLDKLSEMGAICITASLTTAHGIAHIVEQLPTVDIAIFNAGTGIFDYAEHITDQQIDEMLTLNIAAQMKLTKYLLPKINSQLIYIGSQAGKVATPKASVYAATKHALIGYTNALRLEQRQKIITVIHPGPIDTPFIDHADATKGYRQAMGSLLLTPEQVVNATIRTIGKNKRQVNIPWYMGISSKLYAIAPATVEKIGQSFFNKK